jgi:dTMP kinase
MERGALITIEGIDGAGKTTLAAALVTAVRGRGVPIAPFRDPGGVAASERVRALVKDPSLAIGARAEALLYAAARAQLVQEAIAGLLAAGTWVLLDRFVDSSLAYQGAGRELGIDAIAAINAFGTGGLTPDRTLLLQLDPALGRSRARQRGATEERLEREDDAFFARIDAGYGDLAAREPARIRTIDASQAPADVLAAALAALGDLLAAAQPE